MADNANAPKGVLLFLTGGPGQPGVPFVERIAKAMGPVLEDYRLVMIDQRGTGGNALQCPELQAQMGSSDLTPPTAGAVRDCAAAIGPDRRFYSTGDTVADLELLRRALGVRKLTLDGVSYGTYTAERYALAHPGRVARLVLDSVVPQTGYDPMDLAAMRAAPRVLTDACESIGCTTDPAADLAEVVDTYDNGVDVLDALTTWGFVDADYAEMIDALHQAAEGDPGLLNGLIQGVRQGSAASAEELSQGLHASTLCLDGRYPWGRSDAPLMRPPCRAGEGGRRTHPGRPRPLRRRHGDRTRLHAQLPRLAPHPSPAPARRAPPPPRRPGAAARRRPGPVDTRGMAVRPEEADPGGPGRRGQPAPPTPSRAAPRATRAAGRSTTSCSDADGRAGRPRRRVRRSVCGAGAVRGPCGL